MKRSPAAVYRIEDRGVLCAGAFADIVVFDYARVHDPATFEEPHQLAEGVVHVLVNGTLAVEDGTFTGALAGRILSRRSPLHLAPSSAVLNTLGPVTRDGLGHAKGSAVLMARHRRRMFASL